MFFLSSHFRFTKFFLWIGTVFFVFEFFLHALGLPIFEHDKIFLFTHDRYIAILALTYAALLVLISSNVEKYRNLFFLVMIGIFLSALNAWHISVSGGYKTFFPVTKLDGNLGMIGVGTLIWYVLTWVTWKLEQLQHIRKT